MSRPLEIDTSRMRLVALTDDLANWQISDRDRFFAALGVEFEPSWPPELAVGHTLENLRDRLRSHPGETGWFAWAYISPVMNRLVGLGGYSGPPDADGEVEIGYSMLVSYREQGLATEGVVALLDWAYSDARVTSIRARTPEDGVAAQRVLEKAGFVREDDAPDGECLYRHQRG